MTTPKITAPVAKRNPESLTVTANSPEEVESNYAQATVRPTTSAACSIRRYNAPASNELTMDALVAELDEQCKAVNAGNLARGEAMLTAQAHTLDAIFGTCARRAQANMGEYPQTADLYLRLGLRAQSQCRATWETLSQMKNPTAVAFVRQANIANGPQQVNNGPTPEDSRTRESENAPTKLLEAEHERMDIRAAALTGRADPALAAVGEVHGAEVKGR